MSEDAFCAAVLELTPRTPGGYRYAINFHGADAIGLAARQRFVDDNPSIFGQRTIVSLYSVHPTEREALAEVQEKLGERPLFVGKVPVPTFANACSEEGRRLLGIARRSGPHTEVFASASEGGVLIAPCGDKVVLDADGVYLMPGDAREVAAARLYYADKADTASAKEG